MMEANSPQNSPECAVTTNGFCKKCEDSISSKSADIGDKCYSVETDSPAETVTNFSNNDPSFEASCQKR